MPTDKRIVKPTEKQELTNRYQDVSNKEVNVCAKIPVNIEYENNKQNMEILKTERTDSTPLLGMDWIKTMDWIKNETGTTFTTRRRPRN